MYVVHTPPNTLLQNPLIYGAVVNVAEAVMVQTLVGEYAQYIGPAYLFFNFEAYAAPSMVSTAMTVITNLAFVIVKMLFGLKS